MASNPAFGTRLRERLREMNHWLKDREEPDVYQFALKYGHPPSAVYRWLKGEVPRAETFLKLCQDVQRPHHYMLTGSGAADAAPSSAHAPATKVTKAKVAKMAKPIGGGSGEAHGLHVAEILDDLLLIGRWLCGVLCAPARPVLSLGYGA